jgi:hypothetical protein
VVFGALVFQLSAWCGADGYVSGLRAAFTGSPQTGQITLSSTPYRQLENQNTKYYRQQQSVKYSRAPDDGHNGARNMLSKQ